MQRCSWQEAAGILNAHAAAAADLQRQFREVASGANNNSGSKSVPQIPRTSPAAPQAIRPQSALRMRRSTPTDPDQHLSGLTSPRKQQLRSMWRSPTGSSCSSPSPGQHKCLASSSPQRTASPNPTRSSPQHALTAAVIRSSGGQLLGAHSQPAESCASPTARLKLMVGSLCGASVHSRCDAATSDEDAGDSDSESNCVIQQMMRMSGFPPR